MTKKQILRFVAFVVAVFMMIVLMCDLFECDNTKNYDKNAYTYRNLEENIIDGVFIGTSGTDRYWIAPKAYEEYGMSLYALAYDALPSWLYIDAMETAFKNQTPKVILLDVRAFFQSNSVQQMDVRSRRFLDAQPFFSINRLKTAHKVVSKIYKQNLKEIEQAKLLKEQQTDSTLPPVEIPEERSKYDMSFAFSVIKYHSKWADDYSLYENLGSKKNEYGSFFISPSRNIKKLPHAKVIYDANKFAPLDPIAEESLYEVIDYIKEKKLNVLFVDTPQFLDQSEMGRANTTYKILEENGMDYIHYYKNGSGDFTIDLDNTKEFYDESHVNYYGALKFTDSLAKYIDEKYDLPDRRKDKRASAFWNGTFDKVKATIAGFEKNEAAKKLEEQLKAQEEAQKQAGLQQQ